MIDVAAITAALPHFPTWAPWFSTAGVAVAWLIKARVDGRAEQRASAESITSQMVRLNDQMRAELARVQSIADQYRGELERLRAARWELEDRMESLRDQAIAARAMVHELQRRFGLVETAFQPLPRPVPMVHDPPG